MTGQARHFDSKKEIKWDVKTQVEAMQELVKEREAVFLLHRKYKDSSLQSRSAQLIPDLVSRDKSFAQSFERYSEFCQAVDVPLFPVTSAMIALYIFAKNSFHTSSYSSAAQYLNRVKIATKTLWEVEEASFSQENRFDIQTGLKEFQKERTSKSVAEVSHDSLSSIGDSDGSQSEANSVKSPCVQHHEQLAVPGLPNFGQRFESVEELVAETYVALLKVYGSGTRHINSNSRYIECARAHSNYRQTREGNCHWRLAFEEDEFSGGIRVCEEGSNLHHNHGPNPKFVKDPKWKPTIYNTLVRERLGLRELGSGRQTKRSTAPSSESSDSDSEAESNSQSQITFKKPKLPRRNPPPFAMPSSSHASTSAPTPILSARNDSPLLHPLPRQYPSQLQYPPSSIYTQPQSIPNQYQSQFEYPSDYPSQNHTRPVITTLSPSPSDAFLPRLASFLRSLHPSLDSLALPLYTSGIQSKELLDLFCAFEFSTLDLYFTLLKERNPDQEISNVHVRLLKKKLNEAQDGDWAS